MTWRRFSVLFFILAAAKSSIVRTAGNVGCLFSQEVCKFEEWCFDDGAFGRCVEDSENSPNEISRHELGVNDLHLLERELENLLAKGYTWSHRHTQCVLQGLLYSFRTGVDFEKIICERLVDNDEENDRERDEDNALHHENVAYIKYTPNEGNPQSGFADEIYFPPKLPPELSSDEVIDEPRERQPPGDDEYDDTPPSYLVRRSLSSVPGRYDYTKHFSSFYNTPDNFRSGFEVKDMTAEEPMNDSPETLPFRPELGQQWFHHENPHDPGTAVVLVPDYDIPVTDGGDDSLEPISFERFVRGRAVNGDEEDLIVEDDDVVPAADIGPQAGYTEGGVVYFPQKEDVGAPDIFLRSDDQKRIFERFSGFERRERLDVKKPGPPYDPNFKTTKSPQTEAPEEDGQKEVVDNETLLKSYKEMKNDKKQSPTKTVTRKNVPDVDPDQYDVVDTSFTYIKFKNKLTAWNEGAQILASVANLLRIPREIFSRLRVDRNEITFKVVEPNSMGLNASEVAHRIDDIRDELRRKSGVVVTAVGIGDKTKMPSIEKMEFKSDHEIFIMMVIICGVLAALGLSAGVLYLTRRHGYKLKNMTVGVAEHSKHYQDLCRARMSKTSPNQNVEKGGGGVGASSATTQRVTSLSKESDKDSPSSRSSTSSWSDEPALTNMDIETGEAVLAHLEEHLKNKETLDSEWAALCAYDAEPNASTIAQRPENLQKNRYPHALPYDHARVVLNELSNITESDYINASTIADHDPRNAAYIACQGPLPHTVADMWQMIWEQGCVVIVMLTRLGEPDAPLCHRYWPEDGSDIYHIYEVHLVGEYMWCDDYVVRSFYLKNLKTGETRTVTQFHFLSWPDGEVPSSTKSLLEFRRKVNKSFRGRSCPIVVHCSDGISRTGTYCLLDMVLNRIAKGAKEIDVAATLEHIRDQRAGAVTSREQFKFVLTAVTDEVLAILKVLQQQ